MCELTHADGVTSDTSVSDSETIARTTHLQQDEAIRQGNRQKAQQQRAAASTNGQGSSLSMADHQRAAELADRQTGPVAGEAEGEIAEAERQRALSQVQNEEAERAALREDSVQRAQAVVSPFTKATVHRQIGEHTHTRCCQWQAVQKVIGTAGIGLT